MSITLKSRLSLVLHEIIKDKKNYIVEDISSNEFYEMPEVCISAIDLINSGITLEEIEMQLKEKYPIEEVDLLDFAKQLLSLELIAEIDGVRVETKKNNKESLGISWISPWFGKFFFNKISYFFYISLFIINLFLFILNPSLFPRFKDLFIYDIMALNIPIWLVLSFTLVLIHEFGHILAIRAQNLPTKLEVGHRLFLVVLETDMSAVWKLPSKDRNVLFLAGLGFDTVILSFSLISQLTFTHGSGIFLSIINVVVLDTFIRMVYQCCIFMKTDLYYVFENVSGCYNLMENAEHTIRKMLPSLNSETAKEVVFEGERNTVFVYSIFYFIGIALTFSLFAIYYIPQLLFALKKVLPGFSLGPDSISFWDAFLFTLQLIIGMLILLYSWRKKYLYK